MLAAHPLSAPARGGGAEWFSDLRQIVLHMIGETARHAGNLDIAREMIDGTTGLDPR